MAKPIETARDIVRILPLVIRVFGAQVRRHPDFQEPSQIRLMAILAARGRCTISHMADKMAVSLPTMSKSMRRMSQRSWVSLVRDEQDRRTVWAELTPEGRAALDEVNEQTARQIEQFILTLAPSDQKKLEDGLSVMRTIFEAALQSTPPVTTQNA